MFPDEREECNEKTQEQTDAENIDRESRRKIILVSDQDMVWLLRMHEDTESLNRSMLCSVHHNHQYSGFDFIFRNPEWPKVPDGGIIPRTHFALRSETKEVVALKAKIKELEQAIENMGYAAPGEGKK